MIGVPWLGVSRQVGATLNGRQLQYVQVLEGEYLRCDLEFLGSSSQGMEFQTANSKNPQDPSKNQFLSPSRGILIHLLYTEFPTGQCGEEAESRAKVGAARNEMASTSPEKKIPRWPYEKLLP